MLHHNKKRRKKQRFDPHNLLIAAIILYYVRHSAMKKQAKPIACSYYMNHLPAFFRKYA